MRIGKKLCSCSAATRTTEEVRASSVEGIRQRLSGNTPLHNAVLDFFTEAADSTLTGAKAVGVS
jgi:hypothetical protein